MEDQQLKMLLISFVIVLMIGAFVFEKYANFLSKKLLAKQGLKGWSHQRAIWIYKNKSAFTEDQMIEVNRFILSYISGVICIGALFLVGLIAFVSL